MAYEIESNGSNPVFFIKICKKFVKAFLSFFIFVVQYKGMKVGEIMSPDPLSHEWNKKQNKGYGGIAVCLR